MALLKFTRAGRRSIHPANKGGVRWLHEKARMVADKNGRTRPKDPVFFEHGKEYGEDVIPRSQMELLAKRHPDLFTITEDTKPTKAKATSNTGSES